MYIYLIVAENGTDKVAFDHYYARYNAVQQYRA